MSRFHSAGAALLVALALCSTAHAQQETASGPMAGAASVASPDRAAASTGAPPPSGDAKNGAPANASASAPIPRFRIRPVDDAWRKNLPRDADAATQAYLDRLPADVVASSNAYFEGGYWLQLWNFLYGLVVAWLLLRRGLSAHVRDWAGRVGRKAVFRDALFGAFWAVASWVMSLPLTIYQGFVREHQYQMATQAFGPWMLEQVVALGVDVVLTAVGVALLYAVIRRAGERWWLWGTVASIGLMSLLILVAPVWIDPLFNTYKPVTDPVISAAVLQMAKADGVPVDNVYQFDASRQTTRVSANVSGILGSAAVRLNDNLMRTSLPEIRAVMGHELGHYVMNHIYKSLREFALVFLAGFLFAKWAMDRMLRRNGPGWGLKDVGDVASLPLFAAVLSVFFLLATPVINTLTRTQEIEADRFGLNLAREPNGMAEADLKLTEYRKPDPGALEEFVFYDHPSTRFRIHDAMRWRQEMGE